LKEEDQEDVATIMMDAMALPGRSTCSEADVATQLENSSKAIKDLSKGKANWNSNTGTNGHWS
jgi:hypothetical protein